jgi:hypothetical protein
MNSIDPTLTTSNHSEPYLPVDVVFHPNWWHKNYGLSFAIGGIKIMGSHSTGTFFTSPNAACGKSNACDNYSTSDLAI